VKTPKRVLILRHGEKPGHPSVDAESDGRSLSTRGFARASALAPYFPDAFGTPQHLFATRASKHSNRPVETITPLATALGLEINDKHPDDDYERLAEHILGHPKYAGEVVLVCWHHGKISELTACLGGEPPQDRWPDAVFDRVWVIDYPDATEAESRLPVTDLPQKLLFGDASE
jgi:phosphohistidine phosphatase SixA